MAEHTDTQPLDMKSVFTDSPADLPVSRPDSPPPPWDKHLLDEIVDGVLDDPNTPENEGDSIRKRIPEPALIRGALVTLVGLVGATLKIQVDALWVDLAMDAYIVAVPLALAWWIRRHVSPVKK
jgi:hypothetical protein